jgi:lysyl-tRNA synthetase class II
LERSEQEQIRIAKLEQLRALGVDPYPAAAFQTTDDSTSVKKDFAEGKNVTLAGRLMSRRIQGKASFAELQDANCILTGISFVQKKTKLSTTRCIKNFWTSGILLV